MSLQRVLGVISDMARQFHNHGWMLNERYLHHSFSHRLQVETETHPNLLNYIGPTTGLALHPEWPTFKKKTRLSFGRYRCVDGKYIPVDDGTKGGFLDFAIGRYDAPHIGIEFTVTHSWSDEAVVYDFVKLLDARNSTLQAVISFNVILRHEGLPRGRYIERNGTMANVAYLEAVRRLGPTRMCPATRHRFLLISEISEAERRHWYYDSDQETFLMSDEPPNVLQHPVNLDLAE